MEFKKIVSGKDKPQILHLGFRMKWNQGPKGPLNTTYFKCVKRNFKATLATCRKLVGEFTLKFYKDNMHNDRTDESANIVLETMPQFRRGIVANPECLAKQHFEEVS